MQDVSTRAESAVPAGEAARAGRRCALRMLAGAPFAAALGTASVPVRAALKTNAHVVIAGSGLGGIALANRLHRLLDGAKITIIDRKEEHHYQPGFTLVASGIWPVPQVRDRNADYLPPQVNWIREMVAGFDPAANTVVTDGGTRIRYDYLIVATGLHLDYAQIEGMDVAAIGRNGLASVYASPQAAEATWNAMSEFAAKGGEAVMTLPGTPLKCAGAPVKMAFLLDDRLRRQGTRNQCRISFLSATDAVFGVKVVHDDILRRWKDELDIGVHFNHRLLAVDIGARRATFFDTAWQQKVEKPYDFLHVVPPMRAPDPVRNSDLAWKEGPFAAGGWLEVDRATLQHRRYPNVFGIGDINGTPRGKTAATVKKSAPIVARGVAAMIAGRAPGEVFDGYTSCPLILREGSALLIEFGYDGVLRPTLPFIDPMQESYLAWLMKYRLLKPAYRAVLRGRA